MNQPPTPERPDTGTPETHEALSQEEPRIYVSSLSDYNAGRLYGAWINANQDDEDIQEAISEMLSRSTESIAEEWAIHDYEGFGPLRIDEYESIEHVAKVAVASWSADRPMPIGPTIWDQVNGTSWMTSTITSSANRTQRSSSPNNGWRTWESTSTAWSMSTCSRTSRSTSTLFRDLSYDFYIAEDDEGVYVFDTT